MQQLRGDRSHAVAAAGRALLLPPAAQWTTRRARSPRKRRRRPTRSAAGPGTRSPRKPCCAAPGPERRLDRSRRASILQLRVASPVEHVLARDAAAPRFGDRVMLDGESAVTENGATFKECLTGLTLTGGRRRRVSRAPPSAPAHEPARQGRADDRRRPPRRRREGSTTSERLVVDRFVTIKPGQGC